MSPECKMPVQKLFTDKANRSITSWTLLATGCIGSLYFAAIGKPEMVAVFVGMASMVGGYWLRVNDKEA